LLLKIACSYENPYLSGLLAMLRKLIFPHSLIVTCLVFALIWLLDIIRLNLHFLNPFNETIRDYEITDIVYSRLRDKSISLDDRIVLINTGRPDRDTIRMMVDRIVDAGASVIALDILFEGRKGQMTDSLLRNSLTRMEKTVLGIRIDGYDDESQTFKFLTGCDTFFCDNTYTGFTNLVGDDTSTIRYFSPREMTVEGECLSFPVQTARLYDPAAVDHLFRRNKPVEEIYYTHNSDQFVQYEVADILDTTLDLRSQLKDKIVLIGFLGTYAWGDPLLDRHYTPLNPRYTGRNTPDMYGMVIHANVIRMILDKTYVREISFGVNLLLTFVFCYFNIHLFYQIFRRVSLPFQFITRFLQLGEIIILFFIVALLFHFYRVKMDVAYWISALLLTFDAVKFYDNGIRKKIPFLGKIPYTLPPAAKPVKKTAKPAEMPSEVSKETDNKPDEDSATNA
jgi:CHASE2 domain-containing sensor protein